MFIKEKTDPLTIPRGSKTTWVVKYHGGRKPFESEKEARRFAAEKRAEEKGWSELIKQIEIVVVKRK